MHLKKSVDSQIMAALLLTDVDYLQMLHFEPVCSEFTQLVCFVLHLNSKGGFDMH